MGVYKDTLPALQHATRTLLFAANLTRMKRLCLIVVQLLEKDLLQALTQCTALVDLQLMWLTVLEGDQSYSTVLRQLLRMSHLTKLALGPLVDSLDGVLDLQGTTHGGNCSVRIKVEGTANITSRIQGLLEGPLCR